MSIPGISKHNSNISHSRDVPVRMVLWLAAVFSLPAAAIWVPEGGGTLLIT